MREWYADENYLSYSGNDASASYLPKKGKSLQDEGAVKEMNTEWSTPITDRTREDIENQTDKAFINDTDLNRIEGNLEYLAEHLKGYLTAPPKCRTNWTSTDLPTKANIERIRRGVTDIMVSFKRPEGCGDIESLTDKPLYFRDVNMLETNLFLLKERLDRIEASYKKTGFQSGSTFFLPKRRT